MIGSGFSLDPLLRGLRPEVPAHWITLMDLLRTWEYNGEFRKLVALNERLKNMAPEVAGVPISEEERVQLVEQVASLATICESLEFPSATTSARFALELLKQRISLFRLAPAITAIEYAFHSDANKVLFLRLDQDESKLFVLQRPFGDAVATAFPDAVEDVRQATCCAVLGCSTASVLHLMRALEEPLRALSCAPDIQVDFTSGTWHNILDRIEKKIEELQGAKKGLATKERLATYSSFASEFRYIKDAWRNYAAHAKASYDLDDAKRIYRHVRLLMTDMATHGLTTSGDGGIV